MHFTGIAVTLAAMAVGAHAINEAKFIAYTGTSCNGDDSSTTLLAADIGDCGQFIANIHSFKLIELNAGCTFKAYLNSDCSGSGYGHTASNSCHPASNVGGVLWKSYEINC
ncbi:hypothetical protein BX600DRAFT_513954 [Xylariales sp. PMI_506]|nr:hypothetical protein BX600DRAFT_513954 [Xylariales sp. PMI_506]